MALFVTFSPPCGLAADAQANRSRPNPFAYALANAAKRHKNSARPSSPLGSVRRPYRKLKTPITRSAKSHQTPMNLNRLDPCSVIASRFYDGPTACSPQLTDVPPRSAATSIVLAELSRREMELRMARKRRWEKARRTFSAPFRWLSFTRPGKLSVIFTASGPFLYRSADACGVEG
jgi:hypothetical protein